MKKENILKTIDYALKNNEIKSEFLEEDYKKYFHKKI